MNRKNILTLIACIILTATGVKAQRQSILLNDNWSFRFSHEVEKRTERRVNLPHTWNAQDALSGKIDYKRGIGNYEKTLLVDSTWRGKRIFLKFDGVNTTADLFINRKHVGEHRGGYSAFIFEITDKVRYGTANIISIRASNAETLDVMPLVGDFNFYGGIYRDVHLILADQLCISPLDYASSGFYLTQKQVSNQKAIVDAKVLLDNSALSRQQRRLNIEIKDGQRTIYRSSREIELSPRSAAEEHFSITIDKPRLWDGRRDPFMYRAIVSLDDPAGNTLDSIEQPLGLRYFSVDPDKGFFLNGNHLQLRGVCRHQDRPELGNALREIHHQEDIDLMLDMGANSLRLSHYQQAPAMYDLLDSKGIIAWTEIPFVGPGGYQDKGFVDKPAFRDNGKIQLTELIRQNYNHPSVCFWGLFNELKEIGDNPTEYLRELNELAHREDSSRLTTAASNQSGQINTLTDLIAWNRYDGWYGSEPANLAKWLDATHSKQPQWRIGISEYGAGASIYHQQDSLKPPQPTSWWHPENLQTYYHIENWKIIKARPFVWASFIWNMFDFGAAHRTEGDRPGINDKGLISFDRKAKKDAFYFYKANWNTDVPMIHLAEKRNNIRRHTSQTITAFTTEKEAELFINGRSVGRSKADSVAIIKWDKVELIPGRNTIEARTTGKNKIHDQFVIIINPIKQ
jgi:beta-galactosidase